jgi:hypothetical protein
MNGPGFTEGLGITHPPCKLLVLVHHTSVAVVVLLRTEVTASTVTPVTSVRGP